MALYKTEAINLKSKRFAESDKFMTLFTRDHGKVAAIAKSALKAKSKFGGRLEPFEYNRFLIAKGRNLDILSQAETIKTFFRLREDEQKLNAGLYMVKVVDAFLIPNIKDEKLFDLLLECLYMLEKGFSPKIVVRIFDVRFSDIGGFLPDKNFLKAKEFVSCVRAGDLAGVTVSQKEINEIDAILMPGMCEHVGKDIRNWKSL